MPLSLVPRMVLRDTSRPCASNETIAVAAMLVMMLPLTSPETFSNQMPLPPLPVISQSVMRMSRPPRQCTRPRRVGSGMPPPSSVMLVEADAAGAFARQHRRAAVEDEPGRAAHADQLRAVLQAKHPGAIDARRQRQRHLRARGFVDRALQGSGLVVGAAGPDAILRGIAPERRGERRRARGIRRHRQRAGHAADGCSDEMAAIDVHDRVFLRGRASTRVPQRWQ